MDNTINEFLQDRLKHTERCDKGYGKCSCSLQLPIIESDDVLINKKTYNLKKRFDYWNKKIFGGQIYLEKGICFGRVRKGVSGVTKFMMKRKNSRSKKYISVQDIHIIISNKLNYTEQHLDMILIHEMIHVYFAVVKMVDENHGSDFVRMAKDLSKTVGFDIPLKDDFVTFDYSTTNAKKIGVIMFYMDGQTSVTMCSEAVYKKSIDIFLQTTLKKYNLPLDAKIKYGYVTTKVYDKFTMVRNLNSLKRFLITDIDLDLLVWDSFEEKTFSEIQNNVLIDSKKFGAIVYHDDGVISISLFSESYYKRILNDLPSIFPKYTLMPDCRIQYGYVDIDFYNQLSINTRKGKNAKRNHLSERKYSQLNWISYEEKLYKDFI